MRLAGNSPGRPLLSFLLICLFAAACSVEEPTQHGDAAVWMTTDGLSWSRVTDPDLGGPGAQQMTAVATFEDSLVAVGATSANEGDGRVWLSADGIEWQAIADPDLGGPGAQWLNAVIAVGSKLVAVGGSDESGSGTDVIVWVSTDGVDWRRVASPALGGEGDQMVWPTGDPLAVIGGLTVMVGSNGDDAAIWTSTDGLSWVSIDSPEILGGEGEQVILGLTEGGPGLVAVGSSHADAMVWTSPDGQSWTRVESPAFADGGVQGMVEVMATDDELLALGDSASYEEIYFLGRGTKQTSDAAVWTSSDGFEWNRVDDAQDLKTLGDQHIFTGASFGSMLYAGGMDSPDPRTGGLFDAGPASGRDVDAAIWMSADGRNWTKVRSDRLGGEDWQDVFDLVEYDGALFAVGGDDAEPGPAR